MHVVVGVHVRGCMSGHVPVAGLSALFPNRYDPGLTSAIAFHLFTCFSREHAPSLNRKPHFKGGNSDIALSIVDWSPILLSVRRYQFFSVLLRHRTLYIFFVLFPEWLQVDRRHKFVPFDLLVHCGSLTDLSKCLYHVCCYLEIVDLLLGQTRLLFCLWVKGALLSISDWSKTVINQL